MICTFSPFCGTNTMKNALTEYELWLFKITKLPPLFFFKLYWTDWQGQTLIVALLPLVARTLTLYYQPTTSKDAEIKKIYIIAIDTTCSLHQTHQEGPAGTRRRLEGKHSKNTLLICDTKITTFQFLGTLSRRRGWARVWRVMNASC